MISWADVLYVAMTFLVCGIMGLIWAIIIIRKEESDGKKN